MIDSSFLFVYKLLDFVSQFENYKEYFGQPN